MKVRVFAIAGAVLLVGLGGWLVVHFSSDNPPAATKASADVTGKSKRAKNESRQTKKAIPEGVRRSSWFSKDAKAPELSEEQISAFLENSHRSANALIAASRIKNNLEYLREAAKSFPENKTVQLELAIRGDSLNERQEAIDHYRKLDSHNSVGDYLAALIHFQQGKTETAIASMEAAGLNTEFQLPYAEIRQTCEDAYISAGFGAAEAKAAALFGQPSMYLVPMTQLVSYLVGGGPLGAPNRDADTTSRLQQSGLAFSRRISQNHSLLVTDVMAQAIENRILMALPPDTHIPELGKTASQRIEELTQARAEMTTLGKNAANMQSDMTEAEFLKFLKRVETEGEVTALRHLHDRDSR